MDYIHTSMAGTTTVNKSAFTGATLK